MKLGKKTVRQGLMKAATCGIGVLLTFALIEVSLRLAPGLIPLKLLKNFQGDVRSRIARERQLQRQFIAGERL